MNAWVPRMNCMNHRSHRKPLCDTSWRDCLTRRAGARVRVCAHLAAVVAKWAVVAAIALHMTVSLGAGVGAVQSAYAQNGAAGDAVPDTGDSAPTDFTEITPELRSTVDRGLAWLAAAQADDGSWGNQRYGPHVGITSLACLAFMSDGHLPGRGAYGDNVERGLNFVLNHVQETGLIAAETSHGPMYGHGFATLFLGEVYGMTHDPRVRESLVKAVRLIVGCQHPQGGWRYNPTPEDADISVTICQIMALRSARNAGISVPKTTIDRAVAYVRHCQLPDGGFAYQIGNAGSLFPRSAAGVAALYYAGIYEDRALNQGLEYLLRYTPGQGRQSNHHYFYGQYYAVQAMYLAGGDYWKQWFPAASQELIDRQQANGGWTSTYGDSYGTSMALIVLTVPNRFLPIFLK